MYALPRHAWQRLGVAALTALAFAAPATAAPANTPAQEVDLRVLAANDFHGNLEPPTGSSGSLPDSQGIATPVGGAAYLATHLRQLRTGKKNTVAVHAGDAIGGTPLLSGLFRDEPAIDSLNAMGMNIAGVGNHEYDEGTKELLRMDRGGCHPVDGCFDEDGFSGAKFPFLAANVITRKSGLPMLPPVTVKLYNGVPVGFIGVTLEGTPEIVAAEGIKTVRFENEITSVNRWTKVLRLLGVKAIVVLIHQGGFSTGGPNECGPGTRDGSNLTGEIVDLAKGFSSEVDVVVSGHTHWAYVCEIPDPAGNPRLVTSSSSFGRAITVLDLKLNKKTGDVIRSKSTATNHLVTRNVEADPTQTALIAKWQAKVGPIAGRVVGKITADITRAPGGARDKESSLGNLIADAQWKQTEASGSGGAQLALMNPGGVRADLTFAASPNGGADGEVTYGELYSVQPFGNNLVTMTLTGAQIETALEQQWTQTNPTTVRQLFLGISDSLRYTYSASGPVGNKIDPASITLGGAPLNPTATYRVTVNSFLADGGDGFLVLKDGTDRVTGAIDVDAFEDYVTERSPVAPASANRVTVLP
ncbi:MAG: bifunctional metallophosphatase/5'-nucleotidase [Solirubrobacteraceae bacterium]|nr:bifunctional metallophosphatase/5'-nucleotidase [Solirubrobacteraceae bacterium]